MATGSTSSRTCSRRSWTPTAIRAWRSRARSGSFSARTRTTSGPRCPGSWSCAGSGPPWSWRSTSSAWTARSASRPPGRSSRPGGGSSPTRRSWVRSRWPIPSGSRWRRPSGKSEISARGDARLAPTMGNLNGMRTIGGRLKVAFVLTVAILVVEVVAGWAAHSLALLADAGPILTDVFALGLAWFAVYQAHRPADSLRTYGYHRVGILTAMVNAVTLIAVVAAIAFEAVRRRQHPVPLPGGPGAAAA